MTETDLNSLGLKQFDVFCVMTQVQFYNIKFNAEKENRLYSIFVVMYAVKLEDCTKLIEFK